MKIKYWIYVIIMMSFISCHKDENIENYSILCDNNNSLPVSTGTNWYFIDSSTLLPHNYTTSVALDKNDKVWISVIGDTTYWIDSTYVYYQTGGWWVQNYQTDYNTTLIKFNSLTDISKIDSNKTGYLKFFTSQIGFDINNKLFIGSTMEYGLVAFNCYNSWKYQPQGGTVYMFEDFLFDDNNNLWFGSGNGGAYVFNGSSFTQYDGSNSIIPYPEYVYDIVQDNTGTIWLTTSNALLKFVSPYFHIIYTNFYAQGMDIDDAGNIWIINGSKLIRFHDLDTVSYPIPFTMNSNTSVQDIEIDNQNNIWIATGGWPNVNNTNQGMLKFDGTNWTVFNTSNSPMPTNNLFKIKADKNNNIWVCTKDKGVIVYNENGIIY